MCPQARERNKRHTYWKVIKEIKPSLFANDIIVYVGNTNVLKNKKLSLSEFSNFSGYKINIQT